MISTASLVLVLVTLLNLGSKLTAYSLWSSSSVNASDYGVDFSFPIHHYIDKSTSPYFAKRYADTMKGCYDKYSARECDATERARIDMNLNQPKTQHNYTEVGFKKLKAPTAAWEPLIAFYEANKDAEKFEDWPRGNTYVNHWTSPTYMVSLENRALRGGLNVKEQIWAGVKPILEEWTGQKLEPTSLYGIRVYKDGAMLATRK
jgi:prolyl 4-hydroxylase